MLSAFGTMFAWKTWRIEIREPLSMKDERSLSDWIDHVFDHPVTKQAWHWEDGAPQWEDSADQFALFMADTFERSGELLAPFSDAQLDQGFWYLNMHCEFMERLTDQTFPPMLRERVLRSFVPLFEQVMAVRCSPHLSILTSAARTRSTALAICGGTFFRFASDKIGRSLLDLIWRFWLSCGGF